MSDDLRWAYLMGDATCYMAGNLPGDNPDLSETRNPTAHGGSETRSHDMTAFAFAAVPQYHNDPWSTAQDQDQYIVPHGNRPLKPDGSLNLVQNKDWSGTTYMLEQQCPKPTGFKQGHQIYGIRICY